MGEFNGMSSQSHVSHCRVLPLDEFIVTIPEPHDTLQGAVISWHKVSPLPIPPLTLHLSLSLSLRRDRTTTTHYTHHQVSLMVSRNTTLVPFLGLRIGPACEAGLSAGMRRERVPP